MRKTRPKSISVNVSEDVFRIVDRDRGNQSISSFVADLLYIYATEIGNSPEFQDRPGINYENQSEKQTV